MKKILSMVLTLVMLVSIFSTVLNLGEVAAESVTPTPTLSSSDLTVDLRTINASPGDYITVPLSIRNVPDKGILTFDMTISYDPNCLEYLAYEAGNVIPNPSINFVLRKNINGSLKLLFLDHSTKEFLIKNDGLVANLKFKVLNKTDKSTSIKVSNPTFGDYDLNYIIPKLVPGQVNISDSIATPIPQNEFTVKIGSEQVTCGDKISIPVTFSNIPSKGITTCNLTIAYDPDKLEYEAYDTGKIVLNPDINFSMNKPHDGLLKLLFLDYTAENEMITSNGTFVNLTFKVLDSHGPTSINVVDSTFGDVDVNPLNAIFVPGVVDISEPLTPTPTPTKTGKFTVVVGSAEGKAGDVVNVPISIENVPSTGIQGFDCIVSYDAAKLEYLPYKSKGFVDYIVLNKCLEGEISILFSRVNLDSDKCIKEDGEIANIAFKVLETKSESTPIKIRSSQFIYFENKSTDVQAIDALINSGSVNIIGSILPTQAPTKNTDFQINVGSVKGKKGDLVTVPVNFKGIPKGGITCANMFVNYDSALLECVSIDAGSIVPNSETCFYKNNRDERTVALLYASDFTDSSYITKDGAFATITFRVLYSDEKSTQISVSCVTIGDINLNRVEFETVSGVFEMLGTEPNTDVTDFEINIGSVKGKTGDLVTVPVSFKNVPKDGMTCASMLVNYDAALLECVSIDAGNIIPNPEMCFDKNIPFKGDIKFLYFSDFIESNYINKDGVFANITFRVLSSYDKSTKISISDISLGDIYLNNIPFEIVSGAVDISGDQPNPGFQVEIGSTKRYISDLITIPVSISNIPANDISSMDMILNYDASCLEYVSYNADDSIIPVASVNFAVNKETEGKLKMVFTNLLLEPEYEINSEGVIVYLTFRVISSGESTIYASKATFFDGNLEELNPILVPGKISLSEPPLFTEKIGIHPSLVGVYDNQKFFMIEFSKVPSNAISSVSMTVDYDPTKLKYDEAFRVLPVRYKDYEIARDLTIEKISDSSFKLFYKASDERNLIEEGVFAHLYFDSLALDTKDYSIQIKDVTFTDKYGRIVGAEMKSVPVAEVSIGTVEASEGSTVVVPVKLDAVPECGVYGGLLNIDYDPKVLEYVNYEAGSIIPNPARCSINSSEFSDKLVLCVDTNSEAITTKGELVYLTFKVKGASGFSPIKFGSDLQFLSASSIYADSEPKVLSIDGGVSISGEEPKGYTVSGCVYSNLANDNFSNFAFNEGFKVELEGTSFSAVTDSTGYFEIKNLPAGKYTIGITKVNYLKRFIENIAVDKDKALSTATNPITLWCGDIGENGKQDGAINLEDIMQICKVFNSVSGDGNYKGNLDLNKDGAINLEDIMIIVKNFNRCSSDYQ